MGDQADFLMDETGQYLLGRLKPELKPGERLLWASRGDRPSPTEARRSPRGGFAWAFRLGLAAVACFLIAAVLVSNRLEEVAVGAVVIGLVAGLFSGAVLLGSIASALAWSAERARLAHRIYALTDARALILEPMPRSSAVIVHTFPKGSIRPEDLTRMQYPDGSGDLVFRAALVGPGGFYGVADVRQVDHLVRQFLIPADPERAPEPSYSEY